MEEENKTNFRHTLKKSQGYLNVSVLKTVLTREGINKLVKKVAVIDAQPWKIALSIALGVFIGLAVPMGLQTIVAIPLAFLFGCNVLLTTVATLVTNPFTVIPLYYINFKIGELLTSLSISNQQIDSIISNPTFSSINQIGLDAIILFFTGSITQGLFYSIASFFLTLQVVNIYRRKKTITNKQ